MSEAASEAQQRDAMSLGDLTAWAWRETPPAHSCTSNLLIDIVAVPMFVAGHALLLVGIASSGLSSAGAASIVLSLLQALTHALR